MPQGLPVAADQVDFLYRNALTLAERQGGIPIELAQEEIHLAKIPGSGLLAAGNTQNLISDWSFKGGVIEGQQLERCVQPMAVDSAQRHIYAVCGGA